MPRSHLTPNIGDLKPPDLFSLVVVQTRIIKSCQDLLRWPQRKGGNNSKKHDHWSQIVFDTPLSDFMRGERNKAQSPVFPNYQKQILRSRIFPLIAQQWYGGFPCLNHFTNFSFFQ